MSKLWQLYSSLTIDKKFFDMAKNFNDRIYLDRSNDESEIEKFLDGLDKKPPITINLESNINVER